MRIFNTLSLLTTLLMLPVAANAQLPTLKAPETYFNYVPNASFELTSKDHCLWNQKGRAYMENIMFWDSPTEATPDILSTRVEPTCWANPRKHSNGKQGPRNGDNIAGIKTYGKGGTDTFWHEYIMVELDSALLPGQRYYAEFYTNRAVASSHASNNIGMYFSDEAVITRDRMPLFFTPQVNTEKVIKSKWNMWQKVYGVFEVDSEKKFLLIGNFYMDEDTQTEAFPEGEKGSYYYIDDVMVRRAKPGEELTPKPRPTRAPQQKRVLEVNEVVSTKEVKLDSIDYKVGNTIRLENIFFEFDKAALLPQSKTELQKLIDIMLDYPLMKIEIAGHTDNVGTATYNQKLSEERAKSVVEFLINAKVEQSRLTYNGYGSSRPATTNETDAGRAYNRRVEFTIMSN
jgi:outer membrane protein OmpA-like peptidoglycan-associated protein